MCKNWIEIGVCRYGSKCQFAHGQNELVEKNQPVNHKYKSKQCYTFQEKLYCPYGSRCFFRHDEREAKPVNPRLYQSKLNDFAKTYSNAQDIESQTVNFS